MPTVGFFGQQYWNGNRHTNVVVPPPDSSMGGYPLWQSSVSIVVFGPPLNLLRVIWRRFRFVLSLVPLLWWTAESDRVWVRTWLKGWPGYWLEAWPGYSPQERYVFDELATLFVSDTWPKAQQAVAQTATTAGFNEPKYWKGLSTMVHATPGKAAQHFRHQDAVRNLQTLGVDRSSHEMNFVVEAAYHAFTQIPKRTV